MAQIRAVANLPMQPLTDAEKARFGEMFGASRALFDFPPQEFTH
ncbi:hypothetical protein [Trinickia symbiotica]|nr:hypothetical protein [Trinickia symbiotica]